MPQLSIEIPLIYWLKNRDNRIGDVCPSAVAPDTQDLYVTYERAEGERCKAQGGATGLSWATLNIDVWSQNHALARSVTDKIVGDDADPGLDGMTFAKIGDPTKPPQTLVQRADLLDQQDGFANPEAGQETGWYRIRSIFKLFWSE